MRGWRAAQRQVTSSDVMDLPTAGERATTASGGRTAAEPGAEKVYLARAASETADALHAGGEAGNHSLNGDVGPVGETDTGRVGRPAQHVLPVV